MYDWLDLNLKGLNLNGGEQKPHVKSLFGIYTPETKQENTQDFN